MDRARNAAKKGDEEAQKEESMRQLIRRASQEESMKQLIRSVTNDPLKEAGFQEGSFKPKVPKTQME